VFLFSFFVQVGLVGTRILMAILVSSIDDRFEVGARRALIERSERCSGTSPCVSAVLFAELQRLPPPRFPSLERASPNDRKTTTGLPSFMKLKNQSIADMERNWQGNHGNTDASGKRRRMVFDHGRILLTQCFVGDGKINDQRRGALWQSKSEFCTVAMRAFC
jgi:hypothetical protein